MFEYVISIVKTKTDGPWGQGERHAGRWKEPLNETVTDRGPESQEETLYPSLLLT